MAKRKTGVGRYRKSHSHKTKKRLEIKRLMLEAKANKKSIPKTIPQEPHENSSREIVTNK
jgi:hypothetical protein